MTPLDTVTTDLLLKYNERMWTSDMAERGEHLPQACRLEFKSQGRWSEKREMTSDFETCVSAQIHGINAQTNKQKHLSNYDLMTSERFLECLKKKYCLNSNT